MLFLAFFVYTTLYLAFLNHNETTEIYPPIVDDRCFTSVCSAESGDV